MINYYHPQNKTKGYQMKPMLNIRLKNFANCRNKFFPSGTRRSMQYNKYRGIKQLLVRPNLYGPNLYLLLTN